MSFNEAEQNSWGISYSAQPFLYDRVRLVGLLGYLFGVQGGVEIPQGYLWRDKTTLRYPGVSFNEKTVARYPKSIMDFKSTQKDTQNLQKT